LDLFVCTLTSIRELFFDCQRSICKDVHISLSFIYLFYQRLHLEDKYIKETCTVIEDHHSRVAIMHMVAASFLTTLLLALSIDIAAKPVLERKSPMKILLKRGRISANYNVVERDQHRRKSSRLGGAQANTGNQNDSDSGLSSESVTNSTTDTPTIFQGASFILTVGVGDPPTSCK
jgi:hypothetical protein